MDKCKKVRQFKVLASLLQAPFAMPFLVAFYALFLCWGNLARATSPVVVWQRGQNFTETYQEIPCPSRRHAEALLHSVHWKNFSRPYQCDNSAQGKMAQVLGFLETLDLPANSDFPAHFEKKLRRPLFFLQQNINELSFNLNDPNRFGQNDGLGKVELNSALLNRSWLELAAVLVHEASHSQKNTPGHFPCVHGDHQLMENACDEKIDGLDTDGANAYELWFYLAYARRFQRDVHFRQSCGMALNQAQYLLLNRFNKVNLKKVQAASALWALTADGQTAVRFEEKVGPRSFPLGRAFRAVRSSIIGPAPAFISLEGNVFSLTRIRGGLEPYLEGAIPQDFIVRDFQTLFLPSQRNVLPVLIGDKGVYFLNPNSQDSKLSVVPLSTESLAELSNPLSGTQVALTQALGGAIFLSSADNDVFLIGPNKLKSVGFNTTLSADKNFKWKQILGDIYNQGIWAVDLQNRIFHNPPGEISGTLQYFASLPETFVFAKMQADEAHLFFLTAGGEIFTSDQSDPAVLRKLGPGVKFSDVALVPEARFSNGVPFEDFSPLVLQSYSGLPRGHRGKALPGAVEANAPRPAPAP